MPRMNGVDATVEIRKLAAHAHTPIIATTANAFIEDRDRCIAAGMTAFVTKPMLPEVLYGAIYDVLEKASAAS